MNHAGRFAWTIAFSSLVFGLGAIGADARDLGGVGRSKQRNTVAAQVGVPVEFNRFSIELRGCEKQATSAIVCYFRVTNLAGDRQLQMYWVSSRAFEPSGEVLPATRAVLGDSFPTTGTTLISGVPTSGTITFGGVAANVNQLTALEAYFLNGQQSFTVQYRNVPLSQQGAIQPTAEPVQETTAPQPAARPSACTGLSIAGICVIR